MLLKASRYTSHFYRDTFAKVYPLLAESSIHSTICIGILLQKYEGQGSFEHPQVKGGKIKVQKGTEECDLQTKLEPHSLHSLGRHVIFLHNRKLLSNDFDHRSQNGSLEWLLSTMRARAENG